MEENTVLNDAEVSNDDFVTNPFAPSPEIKVETNNDEPNNSPAEEVPTDEAIVEATVEEVETAVDVPTEEIQVDATTTEEAEETDENVSEEVPNEENAAVEEPANEKEDFRELISNIDTHFTAIRNLLKYVKDKDANIAKLSSELQTYREGLETKLYKSIALEVIGIREDFKKTIREFKEKGLTVETSKKYLKYLVYDYEDFLGRLNIEVEDEKVFYNKKLVNLGFDKKINVCEIEEFTLPEEPKLLSDDKAGVIQYLADVEGYIAEVIKNNSYLDKLIKIQIENSTLYEQGIHQMMVYPIVNEIASLYGFIQKEVDSVVETLTDENATEVYEITCKKVIDGFDEILSKCSVTIESYVSDKHEPTKHRLLKLIYSNNYELDGKIANVYSDCYSMDSRVIYPQKVDVIKYKE